MNYWLDIRLKIRRFFRNHKRKIIIILIVWACIFAINYYLKHKPKVILPQTTYKPHSPIIDTTDDVPEKYKEPISNLINNFIEYCKNKDYDGAYNLLSNEYKNRYYPSIYEFKKYVEETFDSNKIYNIQNFSNINNVYVYRVRILNDIMADGTTDGYEFIEPKYVVKEEDGILKLSLGGYCGSEELNIDVEDDYMNIKIKRKYITYSTASYEVEITNKTGNYIVLSDSTTESDAIQIKFPQDLRTAKYMTGGNFVVLPNDTFRGEITFDEYFDDKQDPTNLLLNSIEILPNYTGYEENAQKEKENAIKLYSLSIDLIPKERK